MRSLTVPFLMLCAVMVTGCGLSPEQSRAYNKAIESERVAIEKLNVLEGRLAIYKDDAKAILEKVKKKELPWSEAAPLIAKITANFETDKKALIETKDALREVGKDIKALKDLKIPWYYYIGPVLTAILGIAGGSIPGYRAARTAGRARDAAIVGLEASGSAIGKRKAANVAHALGVGVALAESVIKLTSSSSALVEKNE